MRLQAVIFDWAGTTVDHGSLAPVRVLQRLFETHGVPLEAAEARAFMGLLKRDHIEKTLTIPRVHRAWMARRGMAPNDRTVAGLFAEFIPLQLACLAEYSTLIPGVTEAVKRLRAGGLKIGSTTGYTRPMLNLLLEKAEEQGYTPDCSICPDDVAGGRPRPWMIYQNAIQMQVYPLSAIVKVGDTESDIAEGRNAGTWTVGVVRTGNLIGLSAQEWEQLPVSDRQPLLAAGRARMQAARAHFVIDSVAEIDGVLDQIEERLAQGELP